MATLRRFAQSDGRVEVHLRDGRIAKLAVDDRLFCVERLWDQRAETGYMRRIEDEFQALADKMEAGRSGALTSAEYRCITRFWGLWHWRNHFIDSPCEDAQLNGIAGESLTLDKRVRGRVLQRIRTPSQRAESVEGILEMADFKEREHRSVTHAMSPRRAGFHTEDRTHPRAER